MGTLIADMGTENVNMGIDSLNKGRKFQNNSVYLHRVILKLNYKRYNKLINKYV